MQSEDDNPSKRKYLRSPLLVTKVKDGKSGKIFFGYANNISRKGLFIQSINPRAEGEVLIIEFSIPGIEEPFSCAAEVIWRRDFSYTSKHEPGMGLMFLDLPEDKAAAIDDWVVEHSDH